MWSLATTIVQCRLRLQLNSVLFAKTLVRKDVASSAATESGKADANETPSVEKEDKKDEDDFSSKAQIMAFSGAASAPIGDLDIDMDLDLGPEPELELEPIQVVSVFLYI